MREGEGEQQEKGSSAGGGGKERTRDGDTKDGQGEKEGEFPASMARGLEGLPDRPRVPILSCQWTSTPRCT